MSTNQIFTWGLNIGFFVIILFIFLSAKKNLQGKKQNYVEYAPSLMTSLGLFGTFLGIFIGLIQFDTNQIDGSIEHLLEGLKTAFVTSLIGMFFAMMFKVAKTKHLDEQIEISDNNAEGSSEEISPKDIYNILAQQNQELSIIAKGIGGNDERSMVGQIQMLRTDINDFRSGMVRKQDAFEDQLWQRLTNFANMLSKSATQQVIEALKEVIVDFNKNLTDQFGDNFKRLDESVKKLVEWQAGYMVQLDEMSKLYAEGVKSISATQSAVESIQWETSHIPTNMQALNEVMTVNQHQISELSRHLDTFVKMKEQAVVAVPQIQAKLEEIGQQLMNGAEKVNIALMNGSQQFEDSVTQTNQAMLSNAKSIETHTEQISEELKNSMELLGMNTERIRTGITSVISSAMESIADSTTRTLQAVENQVQTTVHNANDNVNASSKAMVQSADRSLQAVEKQIQEAVNRTNEAVNSQLRQLDEALSKQLNAALQELGSALATIARHLTESYQRNNRPS